MRSMTRGEGGEGVFIEVEAERGAGGEGWVVLRHELY